METKKTSPEFKVGDEVRIVRSFPDSDCGWMPEMEDCVGDGKIYAVSRGTNESGYAYVDTDGPGDGWWFPPEALELVPKTYGNEEDD